MANRKGMVLQQSFKIEVLVVILWNEGVDSMFLRNYYGYTPVHFLHVLLSFFFFFILIGLRLCVVWLYSLGFIHVISEFSFLILSMHKEFYPSKIYLAL